MFGEKLGDVRGQNITTRILPDIGTGPRMEITDQASGTLCGVHVTSTVTYVGTLRANGTISGEGTGVVMTEDGESATFRGAGVATFTRPGATQWTGALFYETTSQKLSQLNGIAVPFEYSVDEGGKSEAQFYAWK